MRGAFLLCGSASRYRLPFLGVSSLDLGRLPNPQVAFLFQMTEQNTERRSMSREIKIHLPEAQCDALAAEAKREGRSFFDHCRAKLLANTIAEPSMTAADYGRKIADGGTNDAHPTHVVAMPKAPPDRIDRLEAIVMQMADAINNLANAQHIVEAEPAADIDVDDVVNQSLETAHRYGVPVDREQAPASSGGIRPVGQRMVSRLAVGVPTHVAGLFPSQ